MGQDQDDVVVMPLADRAQPGARRQQGEPRAVAAIMVKVHEGADMVAAGAASRRCCASAHRCSPAQDDDF